MTAATVTRAAVNKNKKFNKIYRNVWSTRSDPYGRKKEKKYYKEVKKKKRVKNTVQINTIMTCDLQTKYKSEKERNGHSMRMCECVCMCKLVHDRAGDNNNKIRQAAQYIDYIENL